MRKPPLNMLFVNELFASIQGEGRFTGTPCVFVRFQGCSLRCPWCDTPGAMAQGRPNGVGLTDTMFLAHGSHATVSPAGLWEHIHATWPQMRHLVLTGGEPCQQDARALAAFCACVARSQTAWRIHVETSGQGSLQWIPGDAWVTLSPKLWQPGAACPVEARQRANEIKMVVGDANDLRLLDAWLPESPATPVCLQPRSQSGAATALCLETVLKRAAEGYTLSVQTHKYLGVR